MTLRRLFLLVVIVVPCLIAGGAGLATADLNSRVQSKSNRAEALRAAVARETRQINNSAGGLARAQARLSKLNAQNQVQQAELNELSTKLRKTRIRLTRLQNRLMASFSALKNNLNEAYRNPQPDLVGVVLGAHDFGDLIEKRNFYKRISNQNARIVRNARFMRVRVQRQTNDLVRGQRRQRVIADRIEKRTRSAQTIQSALLANQQARLQRRGAASAELNQVNSELGRLRRQLMQAGIPRGPGAALRVAPGGAAQAPAGAPPAVVRVIAAGNAIAGLPYVYGGGHGSFKANAYDCSGSISYALGAAGLVNAPMASGPFMSWGESGPGKWITVYANAGHAFMVVAGWRFDTSALRQGGTRWTRAMRSTAGFVARHPPGL